MDLRSSRSYSFWFPTTGLEQNDDDDDDGSSSSSLLFAFENT